VQPKAFLSPTTSRPIQDLPKLIGNPEYFIHTLLKSPPYDQNRLTFHLHDTLHYFLGEDHFAHCSVILNGRGAVDCSVAYLLKARTVEAEQQALLGNGPYTRSKGTRQVRCDVTQQSKRCRKRRSLWVRRDHFYATVR
jgi:hypothetical protein